MTIKRWGAFSVLDHKNDRQLATEVLLYDNLLIPTPPDGDQQRWIDQDWDPQGLKDKIKELGDIAIPAAWNQDRQKDWADKFYKLKEDQQDINSALEMTRRVLIDHERKYRPEGVDLVEVFSAYQSREDFFELEPSVSLDVAVKEKIAQTNCLLSHRLAVPKEKNDAENLKRALDLAHDPTFMHRRNNFYEWQHKILSQGHMPVDAASAMIKLTQEFNVAVEQSGRDYSWETVVLCCSVTAGAIAAAAGLNPDAFAVMGAGPLAGAEVVQIGSLATSTVIQVVQHVAGKNAPEEPENNNVNGAMFHQIEEELGRPLH